MDNLWTRRTNSSKLSLTTSNGVNGTNSGTTKEDAFGRAGPSTSRRFGSGSETPTNNKRSGFNTAPIMGMTTPSSAAFGLGSGAFASFGSAKTPKTPGNPFESALGSYMVEKTPTAERSSDEVGLGMGSAGKLASKPPLMASILESSTALENAQLKDSWSFWFRPPIPKAHGYVDYEKTLHGIANVDTVEHFWLVYGSLKRPSTLPPVSDYHLFKQGIMPIWEVDANKKGGKLLVRLKKGFANRLWEDLLLALIGDQFCELGDNICGAVLSVRNGEDTLSIWLGNNDDSVAEIRESMKHILNLPANTRIEFKSHDSSIQQRTAIDESRREKAANNHNNNNNNNHHHHHHHHNTHRTPSKQQSSEDPEADTTS